MSKTIKNNENVWETSFHELDKSGGGNMKGWNDKEGYHLSWDNGEMSWFSMPTHENVAVYPSQLGNSWEVSTRNKDNSGTASYLFRDDIILSGVVFGYSKNLGRAFMFGDIMRTLPRNMNQFTSWAPDVWPRFGLVGERGWFCGYPSGNFVYPIYYAPLMLARIITPSNTHKLPIAKDTEGKTVEYKSFMVLKAFGVHHKSHRGDDPIKGFTANSSKISKNTTAAALPGLDFSQ